MQKIELIFIFFLLLLNAPYTRAQDIIYLADETFQQGKVLKKEQNSISFKSFSSAGNAPVSISKKEVLMVIYEGGTFEVYPDAATKSASSTEIISPVNNRTSDWIITANRIVNAKIIDAAAKKISYTASGLPDSQTESIDKSAVLAVFYKSGKYSFFAPPSTVATALRQLLSKSSSNSVAAEPLNRHAQVPAQKDLTSVDSQDSLPFNRKELEKRAMENASYLEQYISIIADKETENEVAYKAIDKCLKMFVDDAQIQISVAGSDKIKPYSIHEYLKRLRLLDYDKIEIIWHKINYISSIRKSGDKYYGTISYEQEFRAYKDGMLSYTDITEKNMEVVVQPYEKIGSDGQTQTKWEVFFGDIGVMVTRKN